MSKEVVLDIETRTPITNFRDYSNLRISLVGVYFYETDSYEYFLEEDLPKLWPRLEHADRIIGFNQKGFDNPVMNNYYAGDINTFPQVDLLELIHQSLGHRVKLDAVAQATLGVGKTGHGLQAVEFWKEGKIKELADYCLQDVKVTKEVYDFACEHGYVKFEDRMGNITDIPLEITYREVVAAPAINLTMPL